MKNNNYIFFNPSLFYLINVTDSDVCDFGWSLKNSDWRKVAVFFLRGNKMEVVSDLFNEFAAALQFPYYFGNNWNAFDECLADLDWIEANTFILIITNFNKLLCREPPEEFSTFLKILSNVANEWAEKNIDKEEPSVKPFKIIFHSTSTNLLSDQQRLKLENIDFQTILPTA